MQPTGIYLVYTRYIPVPCFFKEKVYTWYIPGITFPSLQAINHTPGIYLVYACKFETLRTALQQNRDWDAAAHRFWIARVFNVHHSTWRPHSGHPSARAGTSGIPNSGISWYIMV